MVSAPVRSSAPLCPRFLRCRFHVTLGYRDLDPRPRASCAPRSHAKRRHALLWIRLPPNDFCNYISTHGHTHELPILACWGSRITQRPRTRPRSRHAFYSKATLPSRRRNTRTTSRDSPSDIRPTALQVRREARSRKLPSSHCAACGRHPDPTTTCGGGRWTTTLDCTSRATPSEGPSRTPPAAAVRRR